MDRSVVEIAPDRSLAPSASPAPATTASPPRDAAWYHSLTVLAGNVLHGSVLTFAIWCPLFVLHVLPGPLLRMRGVAVVVLAGAAAVSLGARRVLVIALATAAALVALVMFSPISNTLSEWWVRTERLSAARLDAVIVLSAAVNPDTTISSEALDRLVSAIELVNRGRAPVLVTTSKWETFPAGAVTSETDQDRIVRLTGTVAERIRLDAGQSTRDEALSAARVLIPRGIRRIALVTSPMATRRACAAFERVGFVVECVAARMRGAGTLPLSGVPADRFAVFGDWVYEIAAMAEYRARGWVRG
jgi:uncharacterized SAM-binding protein YcdF (DUF218 family)